MANFCKGRYPILIEIEKLIGNGCYEEALVKLKNLRKSLSSVSDFFYIIRTYHLWSDCLYELGKYQRALHKIKVAIRLMQTANDDSLYAGVKLTLGRILVRLGRFTDAVEEFNESYVFYRRNGEYKLLLFPLNSLAQLHFITGNLRRCCEVVELSMDYASKYYSQRRIDIDRRNLARVLALMGDFTKAKSLLDSTDLGSSDNWGLADNDRLYGLLYLLQLDLDSAEIHINRASQRFTDLGAKRDVSVCHEYMGLLEYFRGNYGKVREYYQKVPKG